MADTRHWIVVEPDTAYIEQYGDDPDDPAIKWRIECSDPAACPGWVECLEDHTGYDPDDEESPACDEYDDVMIHGVVHEWRPGYDWTVLIDGCPVRGGAADDAASEIAYRKGVGRWEVDDDWDDAVCYLTVTEAADALDTIRHDHTKATLARSAAGGIAPWLRRRAEEVGRDG